MSSVQRGTDRDHSKGFGAFPFRSPSVYALRAALAVAALIGALALVVATPSTLIAVKVGTSTHLAGAPSDVTGWNRHGAALVLLAVVGAGMLALALRGARLAAVAVAAVGVAALVIAIGSDRPHVHDTGTVGELYADATAHPGAAYYLETLGGALLLLSGGGLLVLGAPGAQDDEGRP